MEDTDSAVPAVSTPAPQLGSSTGSGMNVNVLGRMNGGMTRRKSSGSSSSNGQGVGMIDGNSEGSEHKSSPSVGIEPGTSPSASGAALAASDKDSDGGSRSRMAMADPRAAAEIREQDRRLLLHALQTLPAEDKEAMRLAAAQGTMQAQGTSARQLEGSVQGSLG